MIHWILLLPAFAFGFFFGATTILLIAQAKEKKIKEVTGVLWCPKGLIFDGEDDYIGKPSSGDSKAS